MAENDCSAGALRRAAVCGTLAASIYNTQPWRFLLTSTSLELHADQERHLMAHDPDSRLLTMSCGCALFNARVSLAGEGVGVSIDRTAEDGRAATYLPRPLATVTAVPQAPPEDVSVADLAPLLGARRTNRQCFTDADVPSAIMRLFQDVARAEGASLLELSTDQTLVIQAFIEQIRATSEYEPSHDAERRAWSAAAGHPPTRDDAPKGGVLALLCTTTDDPAAWLRAGEALERVLLEVTRAGLCASVSSDAGQAPGVRERLGAELGLTEHPLVLLRIGHAPPSPSTRRRRLVEVIVDPAESIAPPSGTST